VYVCGLPVLAAGKLPTKFVEALDKLTGKALCCGVQIRIKDLSVHGVQSETLELAVFMNDRSHRESGGDWRLGGAIRTMQLPIPTLSQERDRVFVPGYVQYDIGAGQVAVRSGCRQNRFLCCPPSAGTPTHMAVLVVKIYNFWMIVTECRAEGALGGVAGRSLRCGTMRWGGPSRQLLWCTGWHGRSRAGRPVSRTLTLA